MTLTDTSLVSRKAGGRELASMEDSVGASIRLEDYTEKRREGMITATRNDTDNMKTNRRGKKQKTKMGRKTTLWAF